MSGDIDEIRQRFDALYDLLGSVNKQIDDIANEEANATIARYLSAPAAE